MKKLIFIAFILLSNLAFAQVQFKSDSPNIESFLTAKTVYPMYSKQNCIQGTVVVSFKLNANGEIYSSKINQSVLGDLDEEALRLIRLTSGKWQVSAGYDTATNINQRINFVLLGFNCESKSASEITASKMAYQTESNLMDAVTNFYKNKDKSTPAQEAQIIAIKNQLGIDDDYLESRIKNGLQKYKQGDKQGACEEFSFVKNTGSKLADEYLNKYCN
ncbi:TonB family protein [Pedobacter changchengzhani]|uniref:TonB family protein n=1 Tax=Pedobacter changchengzhani TaxID=2529274 RepID=A0A4R5MQ57_9SPHI|nr:TonB family protein [Pedobacter changchengzhani]TDG37776.1 TonB family protein [Pedobacter changchengzhani]